MQIGTTTSEHLRQIDGHVLISGSSMQREYAYTLTLSQPPSHPDLDWLLALLRHKGGAVLEPLPATQGAAMQFSWKTYEHMA